MSTTTATVRRDGRIVRLDADELVPGDVVVLEAGDRVPADGRLRLPIDGSTDVRIFARRVQCIRPVGTPDLTWAAEATRYPGAHPVSRSEWGVDSTDLFRLPALTTGERHDEHRSSQAPRAEF